MYFCLSYTSLCFILRSKLHFHVSVSDAFPALSALVTRGCRLSTSWKMLLLLQKVSRRNCRRYGLTDVSQSVLHIKEAKPAWVTLLFCLFQKWESVKLLFVKTERSVALPVFSSFVSSQGEAKGLRIRDLLKKVSRSSYPRQASSCL